MAFFQNTDDLCIRKAVQELAHPDDVVSFRQAQAVVQYIMVIILYTTFKPGCINVLFRHGQLARQVYNAHFHLRIILQALQGPFTGIATDVQNFFRIGSKHHVQRYIKCVVGIIVVKCQPAAFCRFREYRQSFI
ncbi:hypothetical protein D3C87_1813900 [compost metagenome]